MQVSVPRIIVAGTHSGCGKTTVASGLMATLAAGGLSVQPFKTGPDFIDPSHHSMICGRVSRNLDPWMMGENGVLRTFATAAKDADVAVIEGAMGLFDGVDGSGIASTAHVAKILHAPVLLVVDAHAVSRSIHAVIKGFSSYDPHIRIAGIIFNRISTERHKMMIEEEEILPALGWIYRQPETGVKSRHLGLLMAHECDNMKKAGSLIQESCDIRGILDAARAAPPLAVPSAPDPKPEKDPVILGVAQDEAFCFYYQDNLDRLIRAGAKLRFFSPMKDTLPDVDALYFGGGYPELYAPALEASKCRQNIHNLVNEGMPIYGECGGLMYLCSTITTDREYRMCDILPARASMTQKIQALGYVQGTYAGNAGSWTGSLAVKGHEFHYSRVECDPDARFTIRLTRGRGITEGNDGIMEGNAIGAYTHAYFSDAFCRHFVAAARDFRKNK